MRLTTRPCKSETITGFSDTSPCSLRAATSPLSVKSWVRLAIVAMRSHVAAAVYRTARRLTAENQLPRHPAGDSSDAPGAFGAASLSCASTPTWTVNTVTGSTTKRLVMPANRS